MYLFQGPPGTGKTTTARIIASHIGVPMVGPRLGLPCCFCCLPLRSPCATLRSYLVALYQRPFLALAPPSFLPGQVVLNFEDVGTMYYGASEAKLRKILGHIRSLGDALVFIDEAEAFFPARGKFVGSHNTDNKARAAAHKVARESLRGRAEATPS